MSDQRAPASTDRIAVVGGGPAGLHAAWLLKERGYDDVTVYERAGVIGGKSLTLTLEGVPHELGTCYLHPEYAEVKRLLALTGATVELKPGGPDGDRDMYSRQLTGQLDTPLPLGEWLLGAIEQSTFPKALWWAPDKLQAGNLIVAIRRYKLLHKRIFGEYEGVLPPRPDADELARIDMTFGQFLADNHLQALRPLIVLSSSAMGYGLLDTVPALYGMWWNTPALLDAFLASARDPEAPVLTMLRDGYGALWARMAATLDIELNTEITEVDRSHDGVRLRGRQGGEPFEASADWLVVASNLQRALGWLDHDAGEQTLFGGMSSVTLITHLVRVDHRETNCIVYWPDRLRAGLDGRLYSVRDSRKCLDPTTPWDGPDVVVTYQYVDGLIHPERGEWLDRQLREDLSKAGYTGVEVLHQHVWPYFTRFTQDQVNKGHPWDLFERQGVRRTWYVGGSASFESVHDITTYTRQVFDAVLPDPVIRRARRPRRA